MCGIAGIIGKKAHPEIVSRMLDATRHRGPDDRGIHSDNEVCLGMNRLAIIDLSSGGHQPMLHGQGRYVMVFNGEIYNYKSIRTALEKKGEVFHSSSDSEVLLRAFVVYGKDCLTELRGIFAFAVWDNHEKKLFAARDHLGIKPFLYSHSPEGLIFCSELKGFISSGLVGKELDPNGLSQFLGIGYCVPPVTILLEVKSLGPGQCFEYKNGKLEITTFWDLKESPPGDLGKEAVLSGIRGLVYESVEEQLISDVPLGVFLSGGMDSAIVLAAMREIGQKNIKTFSVGFKKGNEFDESVNAEKSADFFKTDHKQLVVTGKDVLEKFDDFIFGLDQPSMDGLNTYLVSEIARKEVTVSLSGLGGDELFIGYNWQRMPALVPSYQKLAWKTAYELKSILPSRYRDKMEINSKLDDPQEYYKMINRYFSNGEISTALRSHPDAETAINSIFSIYPLRTNDTVRQICYYDVKLFMAARLLRDNDVMAMKHSLEVRFPLIDHRICEYAWNLPTNLKLEGFERSEGYGGRKKLLFEAFREMLPPDLTERVKLGFKMPYEEWLRGELSGLVDEVRKGEVLLSIMDGEAIESIFVRWHSRKCSWVVVWQLMILHFWMKKFLS